MNDKQQLAAMGEHLTEQQQPMCLQKRVEQLEGQNKLAADRLGIMGDLVYQMLTMMVMAGDEAERGSLNPVKAWMFDAQEALSGNLSSPMAVTETIRTAPERIWLQVGDQSHYHSEPFPSDTSEVSWCADSVIACEVPYVRADLVGHSQVAPKGWQLVPVEPTKEMREAFHEAHEEWESGDNWRLDCPDHQWSAMLAAAPSPDCAK